jgi:hypothetical protein
VKWRTSNIFTPLLQITTLRTITYHEIGFKSVLIVFLTIFDNCEYQSMGFQWALSDATLSTPIQQPLVERVPSQQGFGAFPGTEIDAE